MVVLVSDRKAVRGCTTLITKRLNQYHNELARIVYRMYLLYSSQKQVARLPENSCAVLGIPAASVVETLHN